MRCNPFHFFIALASIACLIVLLAPLSQAQPSLTNLPHYTIGSANGPASFTSPRISLYDGQEGFSGIGNVGTNAVATDTNIFGVIKDYSFYRETSPDVIESYLDGGQGRIAFTNYTVRQAVGGGIHSTSGWDLWTTTSPGTNWNSTPDYSASTGVGTFSNMLGNVSIVDMKEGRAYFFYKSYRVRPILYFSMVDTNGPLPDIVLPPPAHDTANNAEYYVMPLIFTNNTLAYDRIEWEINGTHYSGEPHLDLCGIVLTGPYPPAGTVIQLY